MTLTLRMRVLLLVSLLNAGLFGAGGLVFFRAQVKENVRQAEERTRDLLYAFRVEIIRPDNDQHVGHILSWRHWGSIEDALVVGVSADEATSLSARLELGEEVHPRGVVLNPVGSARRPLDFDRRAALAAILEAVRTGEPVPHVAGGQVVPIDGPKEVWGGLWYKPRNRVDRGAVFREVFPWFLVSTVLLTGGTFFAMRRLVLAPVEQLAEGARRLRAGDFHVRLEDPRRSDELAELVRSFNAMATTVQGFNERLAQEVRDATDKARQAEAAAMTQRRLAAMGELAAGIAHEINNPLGGLLNAVEVLGRADLPPAKRRQYLDLLETGLTRIGETVARLRRFTPREARREPVDVAAIVGDAIDLVNHRAGRLGVRVELRHLGGDAVVPGVKNEVGQAVLNLLSNALDSLEDGGTREARGPWIDVTIDAGTDEVSVEVRDNGSGVEPQSLGKISDLFYTTKEVGKGTGLGLALVHGAMRTHGGRIALASEPGAFFSATLWFPRHPDERPAGTEGTA